MNERAKIPGTPAEYRKFGLTLGIAFLVLAGLSWWRGHSTVPMVLAGIGGVLLVVGLVAPMWLRPIERWWMGLALVLSKVTTPIFMGVIYFLVITPIGLLMRALGRDPLLPRAEDDSFWVAHPSRGGGPRSDMRRQF